MAPSSPLYRLLFEVAVAVCAKSRRIVMIRKMEGTGLGSYTELEIGIKGHFSLGGNSGTNRLAIPWIKQVAQQQSKRAP